MNMLNLSKVQGNTTAILNVRVNFSAEPEGKVKANVSVEKNLYNAQSNPQNESSTEGYIYTGTPDEVKTAIENDLHLGAYVSVEAI